MIETVSLLFRYLLTFIVYLFIYRIARLIYLDIRAINHDEDAKTLGPHLKLLGLQTPGKQAPVLEILPLKVGTTTLGRSQENDIILPSPHISGTHARIQRAEGITTLEDLGSANGTTVNGQRITAPTPLKDGDKVTLSDASLLFCEGGR